MLSILLIILVVIGTFIAGIGSFFFKKGAKHFNLNLLKQIKNTSLILGVFLYLISAGIYIYALSLERLSILYPLSALTYIWVTLLSVKILKEKMNKQKWLGIILIVIGIVLVTYFST